jgi:23S rRNA (cytidine2498-2'-O)-methyltransferase
VSAAAEAFPLLLRQLRDEFGVDLTADRAGPDLAIVAAPDLRAERVVQACLRRPIPFIKHLTVLAAKLPVTATLDEVADAAATALGPENAGPENAGSEKTIVAVQAWASGAAVAAFGSGDAASAISAALAQRGIMPARAQQDLVLSCCLTGIGVLIGLNRREHSITDWPGGRVRLARAPAQISRAEFKLEELLRTGALRLPAQGTALDLGAAPGGWSRVLRGAGLDVVAVDPGELDRRLSAASRGDSAAVAPGIRHARTTAAEFLRSAAAEGELFDVVVNDMRMEPTRSCEVMVDAAARLRPGGLAVLTLKTGTRRVLETLTQCLTILAGRYRLEVVRQLQHNRQEITVVARRR